MGHIDEPYEAVAVAVDWVYQATSASPSSQFHAKFMKRFAKFDAMQRQTVYKQLRSYKRLASSSAVPAGRRQYKSGPPMMPHQSGANKTPQW